MVDLSSLRWALVTWLAGTCFGLELVHQVDHFLEPNSGAAAQADPARPARPGGL
jgi:hypothetical protein